MAQNGFAFGFEAPSDAAIPTAPVVATTRPAVEHAPSEEAAYAAHWPTEHVRVGEETLAACAQPADALSLIGGAKSEADVTPGVYEGGFKIWECALDLLEVMEARRAAGALTLHGARVLEAGCGAGLPGVLALRRGCASLVLQDFNSEVLRTTTMATLRRNGGWEAAERGAVRFVSGDWASVSAKLTDEHIARRREHRRRALEGDTAAAATDVGFDLVLTSDTIYSPAATPALWSLIRAQLRPNGVALVAAKSYYFGVGGSTADFCALVAADARFVCEAIKVFEDGKSNRREVLEVRRRDPAAAAPPEPAAPPEAAPPEAAAPEPAAPEPAPPEPAPPESVPPEPVAPEAAVPEEAGPEAEAAAAEAAAEAAAAEAAEDAEEEASLKRTFAEI